MNNDQASKLYRIWKDDLCAFCEDVLPHLITHDIPDFHKEIYKDIQTSNRYFCEAPRGFAKSFLCSKFKPLHDLLFGLKKDACIISASEGLAVEHVRLIRSELETNPIILKYFGNMQSSKWGEGHLILRNGGNLRARGAEAQIRGFRPDLIVLDDVETEDSVNSEDRRKKMRNWVLKACLPALTPDGQFLMIGTPISPLALVEEFINSGNSKWTRRKYSAYVDGIEAKGHELWPSLWPHVRLRERKEEIGTWAFSTEYMCNPMYNEAAPVSERHIRYWDQDGESLPSDLSMVLVMDPAYKDDEKSDYKVAYVAGMNGIKNRYCVEYIRTHQASGSFIDAALGMYERYKDRIIAFGIPAGSEREFYNKVIEKAHERHIYAPFCELKNVFVTSDGISKRKKERRIIAALQPLFEAGKYFISKEHEELREELLTIGNSRWDDLVDCACYAEQLFSKGAYAPVKDDQETVGRYGEPTEDELAAAGSGKSYWSEY